MVDSTQDTVILLMRTLLLVCVDEMSSEANRSPLAHHPMHSPWNAARGERVPACYDFKPKNEKTSMGRSNGSRDRCRSRGTARGTAPFFLVLFSLHLHTGISIPEKASPSASYSYFRKNEKRYFHNKADYQARQWHGCWKASAGMASAILPIRAQSSSAERTKVNWLTLLRRAA